MTPREALEKAIVVAGGTQTALVNEINQIAGKALRTGHVFYWLGACDKGGEVPPEHAPDIEAVTRAKGDVVRCEDLSPSVNWAVLRAAPAPCSSRRRKQQAEDAPAAPGPEDKDHPAGSERRRGR